MTKAAYIQFIRQLKQEIVLSRFNAAKLVNKELLTLYYSVGKLLHEKTQLEGWGAKVLETISSDLQKALPGLRGFSRSNLANMKQFYSYYSAFPIVQSATGQFNPVVARGSEGKELKNEVFFPADFQRHFLGISFTHHTVILQKTKTIAEKVFYIQQASEHHWTITVLEYQIESNYFKKKGKLPNNFKTSLPRQVQEKAIQAFKDEYLLDFVNIQDPENPDEREIEEGIIKNLRQFILSLGAEFSFMGNQYRITHAEVEYFIDLLFFHRGLKCLIAIDIKRGKFIPEYAGKMNFYLGILNRYVKLKDENPSIGIILCKEKTDSTVEYSIADMDKPIGVSKYHLTQELPKKLKKYLPSPDELINVLNEPEMDYVPLAGKKVSKELI